MLTQTWAPFWSVIFLGGVMLAYAACALFVFKRQKEARRVEPPEKLILLRSPGETLWERMEDLWEEFVHLLLFGGCAALIIGLSPVLLIHLFPKANLLMLVWSGLVLFGVASIWIIRKMSKLLDERANARLGYFGEQFVAEHLQRVLAGGCRVYHDVPKGKTGKFGNIDHVVVGPLGAAVVETKARGKPTDRTEGPVVVGYDGNRIAWPRCPWDKRTLNQVKRHAQWLRSLILRECGIAIPVAQIVAIPGWKVNESTLGQPRVVSGRGVADAVLQAMNAVGAGRPLSGSELAKITQVLEKRCRDVIP